MAGLASRGVELGIAHSFRRLVLALALLWTGSALGAPGRDDPRNLVANGSFQQVAGSGEGQPESWSAASSDRVRQSLRSGPGRDGGRGAELTCTDFPEAAEAHDHAMLQQSGRIALEGGRWYRISFWARAEGITGPIVSVALVDTSIWKPAGLYEQLAPGDRWERFAFDFRAPVDLDAGRSRLQFWFTSAGTLWVDDVLLVGSEGPVWMPRISPRGVRNLVPNSSFECGAAGWGSLTGIARGSEHAGSDLYRLEGEIDRTIARHGRTSLRISLGGGTSPVRWLDHYEPSRQDVTRVLAANHGWFEVVPGAPLTLSAFLRADAEGTAALLVVVQSDSGILRRDVRVGTDWRRESFTFTPDDRSLFVAIGLDLEASGRDRAALWLDGVQLERGRRATAYEPRLPLEVSIEPAGGRAIVDSGESPAVTLLAFNDTGRKRTVSGSLKVEDFFDRSTSAGSVTLAVPPRSEARQTLRLPLAGRLGFFRATWSSSSGSSTLRMAAIPPPRGGEPPDDGADSPFGFNHSYAWDFLVGLARRAGVVWWRDWSAKWQTIEPERGVRDYTAVERIDERLHALGGRVLRLIPYPSATWSSSATGEDLAPFGRESGQAASAFAPSDPGDLAAFAASLVRRERERSSGPPSSYEILNEPLVTSGALPAERGYTLPDYLRLLRAVSAAIRREDPRAVVAGGLGAGPGHPLTKAFVAEGGLDLVDVLDLHVYSPPRAVEIDEERFLALEALMRTRGGAKPVWITEWGCYADDDPPTRPARAGDMTMNLAIWPSERAATEQIVKFTAVAFAHGVRRIFFHAGTNGRINGHDAAGVLFEYGGAPRKMLPGVAVLGRMLGVPDRFLGSVSSGVLRGYLFQRGEEAVAIVWADSAGQRVVALPDGVRAHDIMGNEIRSRRFAATATPFYITAPVGRAKDLERTLAD